MIEPKDNLEKFVEDVEKLKSIHSVPHPLAESITNRLKNLISNPDWLAEEYRQPFEDRYRQHILHVAPDGKFSVVSLVWKPGQATPIHDHVSWCVVGVLQGKEEEIGYNLFKKRNILYLVEKSRRISEPGQTVFLVPPGEDIHKVTNIGDSLAISIHVYGADIAKLGSSINHRFDDILIKKRTKGGLFIDWRNYNFNT